MCCTRRWRHSAKSKPADYCEIIPLGPPTGFYRNFVAIKIPRRWRQRRRYHLSIMRILPIIAGDVLL